MKKLITILISAILSVMLLFSVSACGNKDYNGEINIYMPDGAPALAFSRLMHEENKLGKESVSYNVVSADTIGSFVANGTATVALMPVNAAAKLNADGKNYKMLSVNTHGNLFVIGKQEASDLNALKGKKVGVVNLANVPGLTFKAILKKNNIEYITEGVDANKVTLVAIAPTEIGARINGTGEQAIDFAVAPEPAVTNLTTKAPVIKVRLSLQELWGEGGYPQAVLMVKSELAKDKDFTDALLSALSDSAVWVKDNIASSVTAVNAHLAEGVNPSLDATKLNATAVENCNIKVVKAKDAKTSVKDYLNRIIEIEPTSTKAVTDDFFA